MTVEFRQVIECPKCGHEFSAETAFCHWMRHRPELAAADGVVRADCDHIVHRFKFDSSGRDLQAVMVIEVKTHVNFKAKIHISDTQSDTLHMLNQLMRNRRSNIHKKVKWQSGPGPDWVLSLKNKKNVRIRSFGVHGLYFSGTNPDDSNTIGWDRSTINSGQLIDLLRFVLDPDTLRPMDLRIHQKRRGPTLFDEDQP